MNLSGDLFMGSKVLEEKASKFNGSIKVLKTLGLGTYIQVEGVTQSGGVVEDIWKQTLKKVRSKNKNFKSVLILGLGGGSAAKWVRKYYPESKIVGVDIDPVFIELGKKYLRLGEFGVKIIIQDALGFLKASAEMPNDKFDLILVDIYKGLDVPEKFEKKEFLELVRKSISNRGIAIFNRLYFGEKRSQALGYAKKLENIFKEVDYFYPEANIMFICNY